MVNVNTYQGRSDLGSKYATYWVRITSTRFCVTDRFRTSQDRCLFLMHRWGLGELPACACGAEQQTMVHTTQLANEKTHFQLKIQ
jgi:hypothetical protein